MIELVASDGSKFTLDTEQAKCLGFVREYLVAHPESESGDVVIPLPTVSAEILRLVLEWIQNHEETAASFAGWNAPAATSSVARTNLTCGLGPDWMLNFMHLDKKTLIDLSNAASFLQVKSLQDTTRRIMRNRSFCYGLTNTPDDNREFEEGEIFDDEELLQILEGNDEDGASK